MARALGGTYRRSAWKAASTAALGLKAEGRPAWMVAPLGFESSVQLALRTDQKPKKQKRHFRTEKALG